MPTDEGKTMEYPHPKQRETPGSSWEVNENKLKCNKGAKITAVDAHLFQTTTKFWNKGLSDVLITAHLTVLRNYITFTLS